MATLVAYGDAEKLKGGKEADTFLVHDTAWRKFDPEQTTSTFIFDYQPGEEIQMKGLRRNPLLVGYDEEVGATVIAYDTDGVNGADHFIFIDGNFVSGSDQQVIETFCCLAQDRSVIVLAKAPEPTNDRFDDAYDDAVREAEAWKETRREQEKNDDLFLPRDDAADAKDAVLSFAPDMWA